MALLPVDEALARLLADAMPLGHEPIALEYAAGRVLANDVAARRTQPPFAASAMDGYAVRAADAHKGAVLNVIGAVAAGQMPDRNVGQGTAMRIFTGAPLPEGADAILIQENVQVVESGRIEVLETVTAANAVRPAGLDFREGDVLLAKGLELNAARLSLAAAGGHATLDVWRQPVVGLLATGDELVPPGQVPAPGQIVSSNSVGLAVLLRAAGARVIDLGIARDNAGALDAAFDRALDENCDLLITIGGASVGDHDLVRPVLAARGMDLDFWKIAMRPGKPMMSGRLGAMRFLGLPGNPVSSFVTALVFAVPLVSALAGRNPQTRTATARLAHAIPANPGERTHFMRGRLRQDGTVDVFESQDSSLLSLLAAADCLVLREPGDAHRKAGEIVRIIRLD